MYDAGYGRAAVAREIELRTQLAKRRYVDPTWIAYDYADLGEKEQAFVWLEKAYTERARRLQAIKAARVFGASPLGLALYRFAEADGPAAVSHFFALWKAADHDIPILKQAKAEYAKLH